MPDAIVGNEASPTGNIQLCGSLGFVKPHFIQTRTQFQGPFGTNTWGPPNCHLLWGSWTRVGVGHNPCITCILLPACSKGVLNG